MLKTLHLAVYLLVSSVCLARTQDCSLMVDPTAALFNLVRGPVHTSADLKRVIAAWENDANYVQAVGQLVADGADINARNERGLTPLHVASSSNNMPLIRALLRHRARVVMATADLRWTYTLPTDVTIRQFLYDRHLWESRR
jgi:hypothetical protein